MTPKLWQREILRAFQTWAVVADVDVGLVADGGQPVGIVGPSSPTLGSGDIRIAALPLSDQVAALAMPHDVSAGNRSGDVWLNSQVGSGLTRPWG